MFIAMNRFKVIKGSEAAFENVWLSAKPCISDIRDGGAASEKGQFRSCPSLDDKQCRRKFKAE